MIRLTQLRLALPLHALDPRARTELVVQYRSTRFDAGLVKTKKIGRVRTCKLGKGRLEEEAAWIERYHRLWDDARFDALDRVVEELKLKGAG